MSAFDLYDQYDFLWFFVIYSFLGWCAEVAYAALCTGAFVNRGFLNGPVCPIYGFGVVLVIGALTPLSDNGPVLFAGSVLLTSALEWTTGFVLEKVFHDKWWDYSDMPFNLGGYICLKFSVLWGLACMFIMDIFHPTVAGAVKLVPETAGWIVLAVVLSAFAADAGVTAASILKLNKRMEQMDEIAAMLRETSDRLGESISENVTELAAKTEELKEKSEDVKAELLKKREALLEAGEELQGKAEDLQEKLRAEMEERQREFAERRLTAEAEREQKQLELKAQIEELRDKYEEMAGRSRFIHRRIVKAFPGMKSGKHSEALEEIKKRCGLK